MMERSEHFGDARGQEPMPSKSDYLWTFIEKEKMLFTYAIIMHEQRCTCSFLHVFMQTLTVDFMGSWSWPGEKLISLLGHDLVGVDFVRVDLVGGRPHILTHLPSNSTVCLQCALFSKVSCYCIHAPLLLCTHVHLGFTIINDLIVILPSTGPGALENASKYCARPCARCTEHIHERCKLH